MPAAKIITSISVLDPNPRAIVRRIMRDLRNDGIPCERVNHVVFVVSGISCGFDPHYAADELHRYLVGITELRGCDMVIRSTLKLYTNDLPLVY